MIDTLATILVVVLGICGSVALVCAAWLALALLLDRLNLGSPEPDTWADWPHTLQRWEDERRDDT